MRYHYKWLMALCLAIIFVAAGNAVAQFEKGSPAPAIKALDINGREVALEQVVAEGRDLVILFFFSTQTGEEVALKLRLLDTMYGKSALEIIALGLREDEAALKEFAARLDIKYYIIDADAVESKEFLSKIEVLPVTLFVATQDMSVERVLTGGGASTAALLKHVAENFFQQRKLDKAAEIANAAVDQGEPATEVKELQGYILTAEGKLDEAAAEFGAIDSKEGLAKVAYERGEYDQAVALADEAGGEGYAGAIKGQALMKKGEFDAAQEALSGATAAEADWQKSEALNAQGRVTQVQGNADQAIATYEQAIALDPYNVVALSNEGAALREKGDLPKAEAVLAKASKVRDDDLVAMMLQQVQAELKKANDVKRHELIRQQIKDLSERYAQMKADGTAEPTDSWTTRPLVVAFLPSASGSPVFFERAGTDVVLRREIESRLAEEGKVAVVEREMLDQLLEELNLGSSELASSDTQRQLGQVISAGLLGFVDFAQVGTSPTMYLRLVDTETTQITFQASRPVDEDNVSGLIDSLIADLSAAIAGKNKVQGLIADASSEEAVIINLGNRHGIEVGQVFTVLQDGDPIEVGGRVIAHRQRPVGSLAVTDVEEEYAICKVVKKTEGVPLAKEMKIKAAE